MMPTPDHPIIRRLELYGTLKPDPAPPICPVCGEEADIFYEDRRCNIVGCEFCIKEIDAWDYQENN